jgi:hypothetical protein
MTRTSNASPMSAVSSASPHTKKCYAAIRILAGDLVDEYL